MLGAFGDPGHAFPMLALGERLVARGHRVTFETWARWREHVEAAGLTFAAAPEYHVFPTRERPLRPYEAVARAVGQTRALVARCTPDAVVADILTLGPALAAELEGVPAATLVPHLYPVGAPGLPPYALGARLPRTGAGRAVWSALARGTQAGLRRGRAELNDTRTRVGLAALGRFHGGISPDLCLVATFPQLEYPRRWPGEVKLVGPLHWQPPAGAVELPPGEAPLVLVAPSTSQDPAHRLLRAAFAGLAHAPVRVLASANGHPTGPIEAPPNARLVDWVSYRHAMPASAVVVCHGGHGTVARALACGRPVVACPVAGDMGENAARLAWAGAGTRLPWRIVSPWTLRLAVERALADQRLSARARELAAWAAGDGRRDGAVELLERLAAGGG